MMSGAAVDFWVVTPKLLTSLGSCDWAWVTRICERIRSVFGSVLTSKLIYRVIWPLLALIEYM